MRRESKSFIMLALFVFSLASVAVSASDTSGRASPDFAIDSVTLNLGASVTDVNGDLKLAPGDHQLSVWVRNQGTASGSPALTVEHSDGTKIVEDMPLQVLNAGAAPLSFPVQWVGALEGPSQSLTISISESGSGWTDSNTPNNVYVLEFDVEKIHEPITLEHNIPDDDSLATDNEVRLAVEPILWNLTAVNDGTVDTSVTLSAVFRDPNGVEPDFIPTPATIILSPGNLAIPSVAQNLSIDISQPADISTLQSLQGGWDVLIELTSSSEVHPGGVTVTIAEFKVIFSDYNAILQSPAPRHADEGSTIVVTWMLQNLGLDDIFDVQLTDTANPADWYDVTMDGTELGVLEEESKQISVTVEIPLSPVHPINAISLSLTSKNASVPYTITADAIVLVGEEYNVSIFAPSDATVLPGETTGFNFTLTNNGDVPSGYYVSAGFTKSAENWDLNISTSQTGIVQIGESIEILVSVTPADVSIPLKSGERNQVGDELNLWLEARPVSGGLPVTNSTTKLTVGEVISFSPGLVESEIDVSITEIIEYNLSVGAYQILTLDASVSHNIGSGAPGGMNVALALANHSFTPTSIGGGAQETERWVANFTTPTIEDLTIGTSERVYMYLNGPQDELPLAGIHTLQISASPTDSTSGTFANAELISTTDEVMIEIPSVIDGSITSSNALTAEVGVETEFTLGFANTGNDHASYRFVIEELPAGASDWTVELDTGLNSNPSVISNLAPAMADYPALGTAHTQSISLSVTTHPQAPSNQVQDIVVRVEDFLTGEILETKTLEIYVGELIAANVTPTSQEVQLSVADPTVANILVANTGNVQATFKIWIDDSLANNVDFSVINTNEKLLAPGTQGVFQIEIMALEGAIADDEHKATAWISSGSVNLSADIHANLSKKYAFEFVAESEIYVTPGTVESIEIEVTNDGNLHFFGFMNATIDDDWNHTINASNVDIPIGVKNTYLLNVTIPALGGTQSLLSGDVNEIKVELFDDEGTYHTGQTIRLIIKPIFTVDIENWPEEVEFFFGEVVDLRPLITNTGNKDITASVSWEILDSGNIQASTDWEFAPVGQTGALFEIGEATPLPFSLNPKASNPVLDTKATVKITLAPVEAGVEGTVQLVTLLKMSRMHNNNQDQTIEPMDGEDIVMVEIPWMHIPKTDASNAAYSVALCNTERLTVLENVAELQDYDWSFTLMGGATGNTDLSTDATCTEGQEPANLLALPSVAVYSPQMLNLAVEVPKFPHIYPGDGWNLTFRLYHPTEHANYTVYSEASYDVKLESVADPALEDFMFTQTTFTEGDSFEARVNLINKGTALAFNLNVTLNCEGLLIEAPLHVSPLLFPGATEEITWKVKAANLDWWVQEQEVTCSVKLIAQDVYNNQKSNDNVSITSNVESWNPGVTTSFVALLVCFIVSLIFLRLIGQNENFRLGAVYAGVLGFGFAFHLMPMAWWGVAIAFMAAGWIWALTWRSTHEFQIVHEDYQRARRGESTLYSDHKVVIRDAKRQLSIILAIPIVGFIALVLGLPPRMNSEGSNLPTLFGFTGVVIFGVWVLIWRANQQYRSLYGKLTELEVKTGMLQRDLGDPAKLLTELATDGLDLSSIFGSELDLQTFSDSSQASVETQDGTDEDEAHSHQFDQEMLSALDDMTEGIESMDFDDAESDLGGFSLGNEGVSTDV